MIDWPRFVSRIQAHRRFILTTHVRPDCDAIGSQMAMAGILRALGKDVLPLNGFPLPPNLRFLDPEGLVRQLHVDVPPEALADYDALMVLDTSAWAQLEPVAEVLRAPRAARLVLDHHVSGDDLGAEEFKDSTAEATGRLVVEAADHLEVALTPQIAVAAFAAMATDTGWFRFSSVRGDTYRIAGRLIDAGARPEEIFRQLYETDSLGRLRLSGRAIERAEAMLGGRLIHSAIEADDFAATGAQPSDSEDIINRLLAVAGTEVALILIALPAGGIKASFRSRSGIDVARVAAEFGGGGHRQAAGALIRNSLDETRRQVLDALVRAMT